MSARGDPLLLPFLAPSPTTRVPGHRRPPRRPAARKETEMYDALASLAYLHAAQRTHDVARSALPGAPVRPERPVGGRATLALRRLAGFA